MILVEIWELSPQSGIGFFHYSSISSFIKHHLSLIYIYTSYVRYIYKILVIWDVCLFSHTLNMVCGISCFYTYSVVPNKTQTLNKTKRTIEFPCKGNEIKRMK